MTNSDESPQSGFASDCLLPSEQRIRSTLLGIVAINLLINVWNAARNWATLTFLHHLIGITLWVVLPIVAVALIFRRRMVGRWILVVLFGGRGVAGASYLAWLAFTYKSAFHSWLCLAYALEAAFYLASAIWVFVSLGKWRGQDSP
jgi:hypothetical protein